MVIRSVIAVLVIALAGTYAAALRHGQPAIGGLPALDRIPSALGEWTCRDLPTDSTTAEVLAADATLKRVFHRQDGTDVALFVAYFAQQQVNAQIHSPKNCLPGSGWRIASIGGVQLTVHGANQPATRMLVRKAGPPQEVLYWFRTRTGAIADEYALKWDLTKNSLSRRQTNAAFIRYSGQQGDSIAIGQVMDLVQPHLDQVLGEVGL